MHENWTHLWLVSIVQQMQSIFHSAVRSADVVHVTQQPRVGRRWAERSHKLSLAIVGPTSLIVVTVAGLLFQRIRVPLMRLCTFYAFNSLVLLFFVSNHFFYSLLRSIRQSSAKVKQLNCVIDLFVYPFAPSNRWHSPVPQKKKCIFGSTRELVLSFFSIEVLQIFLCFFCCHSIEFVIDFNRFAFAVFSFMTEWVIWNTYGD